MRLFLLTCLMAVFPVVFMKSPIFGPAEVSSVEGNLVSIKCYYPATSVNRHTRKYWCRQGSRGVCTTLISSEGYVSKDYLGRANLTNFPEEGAFVVNISQLSRDDSGRYKCGLGISSRGLSFDVSLEVSQGPDPQDDIEVYTVDLGRTVTINCPFKSENSQKMKYLFKETGELVINTNYVNPNFKGRASLVIQGTNQLMFNVIIKQLKLSDAGIYICQAGDGSSSNKKYVDLQVLEPEPELVYGELRGSVNFDCALGPEETNVAQFLCRVNSQGSCDVVINTLGKRDPAFEGRILLTQRGNGRFSVLLTGLKKGDAGHYLCGAHPGGQQKEGWPIQAWQLFINEETVIPSNPSVVKGVTGGSVSLLCPYDRKESNSIKYLCRWEGTQNGHCPLLVSSDGEVQEEHEGRLALFKEPGNGTYTVILNQLTTQDAGFYWCLTNGNTRWRTSTELQIVDGKPSLKVPENVTAVLGKSLELQCHFPCKYYAFEKYWCKWSNGECRELPSQDKSPSQALVTCDQNNRFISMTLNSVVKEDEGWYWCGVRKDHNYGETAAVYVAVEEVAVGSREVSPANTNPGAEEKVAEPTVRVIENKAVVNPRLFAEERAVVEDTGDQEPGIRASSDTSSSEGQSRSSKVLLSTLVPLGLVLTAGAVAVWVARARHRKNVDRVSIRSYRTDISMSDFDNSREFGAVDNMGAAPVTQETILEEKAEAMATPEGNTEPEEPKRAKRSSKEEADMAYSAFLLQSGKIAAQGQEEPNEV
ncbi:polymeric immunoglobulin receptor [Marmota monax]|nr:polymeric immunoglobulin receptor [Marmota monax]KAF7486210.1 polymeric immunoglobulin receptor [Marmota monax]